MNEVFTFNYFTKKQIAHVGTTFDCATTATTNQPCDPKIKPNSLPKMIS